MRFCRMQNLQALYTEAALPKELSSVVKIYKKRYQVRVQGTLTEDIAIQFRMQNELKNAKLSEGITDALNSWITRNKMDYPCTTRLNTSEIAYVARYGHRFEAGAHANSYVIFRQSGESKSGRIVKIISYLEPRQNQPHFFALVRQYTDLREADTSYDYFRHLPQAAGYILYGSLAPDPILIPLVDILTHFASMVVEIPAITTPMPCLLVLPL